MSRKHAVVIGSGLGGLAAALRLSVKGWQVTVCEQGPTFGGKMNRWTSEGFQFDTGPSLITMPWVFEDLFATASVRLRDCLELVPVRPIARYRYADGTCFDCSSDLPAWLDTIRRLDPADVDGFLRYMTLGARLFELSRGTFLRRPVTQPPDRTAMAAMRHLPLRRAWGTYEKTVRAHFRSPHLRQLFNRYPTYVGSSPYQCPATLTLIPYLEHAYGGWYVRGGLYRIVETLVDLARERGVDLRTSARVSSIATRAGRTTGVALSDGTELPADVVIMNGDASHTAGMLEGGGDSDLSPRDRSLSGLVFLIGVCRELPELHHHNVYFSADYEAEFRCLFDEQRFPDDPTVYVSVPSRGDRACAPEGGDALFVMANAPANGDAWDAAQTAEARRRVFARLRANGFPDIEGDIVTELAVTPKWMADRYRMPGGAIYGGHSHGWRNAFLRPPNKDRRVKGLYYVGGSAHPGGGTPVVLLSAQIVEELIERHEDT